MILHILFALVVMVSIWIIGWALVILVVRVIVGAISRLATDAVQWTERTRRDA